MSTRGNVVFASHWYMKENNIESQDIDENTRILEGIIETGYKVYIHSDMYPSGALKMLQKYLKLDGAKHRAYDTSYLSAWFIGFKCMHMIPYTRAMFAEPRVDIDSVRKCYGNMEKSRDFFGVGLEHECSDDADFNYIITPNIKGESYYNNDNSFDIHIFDGLWKHICTVGSENSLQMYEHMDWWY